MTTNKKGRAGCNQATPKTSKRTCHSTGLAACSKAAIVTLALWGPLLVAVANWLIHWGGARDD